jgi:hypothetical protein
MRRTATSLAIVALMVTFSSGAALAAFEDSIASTGHTDIFTGTERAERIFGLGGADQINGGGPDLVGGGQGSDELAEGSERTRSTAIAAGTT